MLWHILYTETNCLACYFYFTCFLSNTCFQQAEALAHPRAWCSWCAGCPYPSLRTYGFTWMHRDRCCRQLGSLASCGYHPHIHTDLLLPGTSRGSGVETFLQAKWNPEAPSRKMHAHVHAHQHARAHTHLKTPNVMTCPHLLPPSMTSPGWHSFTHPILQSVFLS